MPRARHNQVVRLVALHYQTGVWRKEGFPLDGTPFGLDMVLSDPRRPRPRMELGYSAFPSLGWREGGATGLGAGPGRL
jgi:hypothetical protein